MTRAAIFISQYPYPLAARPSHDAISLETQEQACRAYCERMGYQVVEVLRATTPTEHALWLATHWSRSPGHIPRVTPQSPHPEEELRRLYVTGAIDVVVRFKESGLSGDAWAHVDDALWQELPREDDASLWEIEPPTLREIYRRDRSGAEGRHQGTEEPHCP